MATPAAANPAAPSLISNQRLLGAALAGLLCLAPAACTVKDSDDSPAGAAGSGEPAGSGASSSQGGEPGSSTTAGDSGSGGAGAGAAPVSQGGAGDSAGAAGHDGATAGVGAAAGMAGSSTAGAGGAPPELPHITSSKNVGVLTEEDFKALCDARGGTVEVMPHCGGFATAKGFSYDNATLLLSEHTCAGANTCGGWNCVTED